MVPMMMYEGKVLSYEKFIRSSFFQVQPGVNQKLSHRILSGNCLQLQGKFCFMSRALSPPDINVVT